MFSASNVYWHVSIFSCMNKFDLALPYGLIETWYFMGARWRSGRASDSESRGSEFDPDMRHRVVSLSKTH